MVLVAGNHFIILPDYIFIPFSPKDKYLDLKASSYKKVSCSLLVSAKWFSSYHLELDETVATDDKLSCPNSHLRLKITVKRIQYGKQQQSSLNFRNTWKYGN